MKYVQCDTKIMLGKLYVMDIIKNYRFFVSGFDDPFSIYDILKMSLFQKGL